MIKKKVKNITIGAEEHKKLMESIIKHSSIGIMTLDNNGVITSINPAVEKIMGRGRRRIGLNLLEFPTIKEAGLLDLFKGALRGKPFRVLDKHYISYIGGRELYITWIVNPIKDKKGRVKTVLILMVDTTDRKRAEEKLKKAYKELESLDKLKSKFISVVSHQLRTPLNSIKWNIEMILGGDFGKLNQGQEDSLRATYRSNQVIMGTIEDLILSLDIEQRRIVLEKESCFLENLVNSVILEFRSDLALKKLQLEFEKPKEALPQIEVDQAKIRKVIAKLLDNAIKYTKEEGRISINLKKEKDRIIFIIRDTGIGIPKDDQPRIFTKFFRASNALIMQQDASGLGLFIAKYLIEAHSGKIWFESEEGKGSTFYFSLPNSRQSLR